MSVPQATPIFRIGSQLAYWPFVLPAPTPPVLERTKTYLKRPGERVEAGGARANLDLARAGSDPIPHFKTNTELDYRASLP